MWGSAFQDHTVLTHIRSNSCWKCITCSYQMLSCLWLVATTVALNKYLWQSNFSFLTHIRSNSCWKCITCSYQMLSCCDWLPQLLHLTSTCGSRMSLSIPCVYVCKWSNNRWWLPHVLCIIPLWANVWTDTPHLSISRKLFSVCFLQRHVCTLQLSVLKAILSLPLRANWLCWSLNRPAWTQVVLAVAYRTWVKCFHCTVAFTWRLRMVGCVGTDAQLLLYHSTRQHHTLHMLWQHQPINRTFTFVHICGTVSTTVYTYLFSGAVGWSESICSK